MREEIGGVDYDDEAKLKFGAGNARGIQPFAGAGTKIRRRARNCFCASKSPATISGDENGRFGGFGRIGKGSAAARLAIEET
jgi:hypothetical protein